MPSQVTTIDTENRKNTMKHRIFGNERFLILIQSFFKDHIDCKVVKSKLIRLILIKIN